MEFNDFVAVVTQWCEYGSGAPLDCWIDEANARLAPCEDGVRCSIDVLDPYDAADPDRLTALLIQSSAGVACHCEGALAIDPDSHCLVLVSWQAPPCSASILLQRLESLANQRAAMLSLLETSLGSVAKASLPRSTLNTWQPGA
ncbi:type III secretion protein [Pseudomonas brassicacearum]|jgi:hypothetical protein|uniref:Type III secretion protein n=1 Tax=Pseudomonas brassicacearum TaxID=930166 RepID=A0A423JQT2_9PSED|nr:type III secretion protein [Pseudomonas brassicacearum]RON40060.1 type III secretion protein [Pseudomonas brassicacearum]